jgi:hypothetical protein
MHYGTEIKEGVSLIEGLITPDYWQIAPGEKARLWEELRKESIVAVGYSQFEFSVAGKSKHELLNLYRQYYPESTDQEAKAQIAQLWHFLHLKRGDKFVANKGRSLLLAVGEVKGNYKFKSDRSEYKHTIDVEYYKVSNSGIPIPENLKGKFGRTIVPLKENEFQALERLFDGGDGLVHPPNEKTYFSKRTFELLSDLHANPTQTLYQTHKEEFKEYLEGPFHAFCTMSPSDCQDQSLSGWKPKKTFLHGFPRMTSAKGEHGTFTGVHSTQREVSEFRMPSFLRG